MSKITDVWFKDGRIYVKTDFGETLSRSLEVFPLLLDAPNAQRADWKIVHEGQALRWDSLDEDIHISSFYESEEPNHDNEVAAIFNRFPQINVSQMAKYMNIDKTLLSRYIYGIKRPSAKRMDEIRNAFHELGQKMQMV